MKRFLLSASALLLGISGFAQSTGAQLSPELRNKTIEVPRYPQNNTSSELAEDYEAQKQQSIRTPLEVEIGESNYDLQTNSAIHRRIINHGNGTISATWTFSSQTTPFSDRGTGYNYFNGNTWGTAPSARIESEMTGWPSLLATSNGRELVIAHSNTSSALRQSHRNTVGTGAWTQANLPTAQQVWNRAASSGNTIHVVGMTLPTANQGTPFNGMDGAFLYSRSSNAGNTWNIVNYQIPGTDSSYFSGFDGDSYSIDAKGDTIAIVVGGLGTGVQLFKSNNNGQSWTKTDVLLSDVWFEETETMIDTALADRLETSDGNVAVLLDADGMAHVWYGRMYIANPDITDGLINYYPGTNAIDYWNESYPGPHPQFLIGALDYNANGVLEMADWGQYRFAGLAAQPQAGIDADGCIYLTYTAVREDLTDGTQNYRHTYVMKSCDNGCSWSFPIDVTGSSANNFAECVFPSIARRVDDDIHVLYMYDNAPGLHVQGDLDPVSSNKMIYLSEDASRFDTTSICPVTIAGDSFLCLGGELELNAIGCASSYSWTGPGGFSANTQTVMVDDLGQYTCTFNTTCGTLTRTINVVEFTGVGGPSVNVTATNQSMCAGDTSVLTANTSIGGLLYQWSANAGSAITQTVTVNNPGTYSVTVTSCGGGSTVETIVISEPNTAPQAVIDGDLTICPGETTTLTALGVSQGSYAWSTSQNTQSIAVNAAGTYTVTVSNCGGTSTAQVTVDAEPLPNAQINAEDTEGCEGDVLTATATGGDIFEWSTGSTNAAISISDPAESGTFTVIVSNSCGDTSMASVTLTINEAPAAPSVTFDGSNFVSSQSGTHQWFVGTVQQSETGNTLAYAQFMHGQQITCIYVDENGCESPASTPLLSIGSELTNQPFSIFPNPNNGLFEVQFGEVSGSVNIKITDVSSRVVYAKAINAANNHSETIDLTGLESGVYQVSFNGESLNTTQSVVIK